MENLPENRGVLTMGLLYRGDTFCREESKILKLEMARQEVRTTTAKRFSSHAKNYARTGIDPATG
jgi:hypothetical protein